MCVWLFVCCQHLLAFQALGLFLGIQDKRDREQKQEEKTTNKRNEYNSTESKLYRMMHDA